MLGSETTVKVEIDRRNQLQPSEVDTHLLAGDMHSDPGAGAGTTYLPPSDTEQETRPEGSSLDSDTLLSLDDDIPLDLQQQLLATMSSQPATDPPPASHVGGKHLPGQTPPATTPTVRTVRFADGHQSDTDSVDTSQSNTAPTTGLGKGKKPRNASGSTDGAPVAVVARKEPEAANAEFQDELLHSLVKHCLIIVPNPTDSEGIDYPQARTLSEYLRWAPNKRSSVEYLRARQMKVLAKARGQAIKTAAIMAWCRANGYTPVPSALAAGTGFRQGKVAYCKYCGLPHIDAINTAADGAMTECGYRHRLLRPSGKYHANSLSVADDLVRELQVLQTVADEDEDMDLDVAVWEGLPGQGDNPYTRDPSHPPEAAFLRHTVGQLGLELPPATEGDFGVDHVLYAALAQFVRQLVTASVWVQRAQSHPETSATQPAAPKGTAAKKAAPRTRQQEAHQPGPGLLLPGHVYTAISQTPAFDFLTNAHMATDPNAP